jgi:Rod binding domain-containing protein
MTAMAAASHALTSGGTAAGATNGIDPRLKPAAHEFEACLMQEFLKPLQHDALFDDPDDGQSGGGMDGESGTGSDNALMSFGSEALAKAISERGGFGIATKIISHFEQGRSAPEKTAGNSEGVPGTGRKED